MNEFVASNGLRVHLEDGGPVWAGGSQYGERKEKITQAFREFFLHERDTELGRWRSKKYPEYVVYPTVERKTVYVCTEEHPQSGEYIMSHVAGHAMNEIVAREYFAAHPESKPWHDAQPGEVWALVIGGEEEECFAFQMPHHETVVFQTKHRSTFGAEGTAITAGRRIWPEATQ